MRAGFSKTELVVIVFAVALLLALLSPAIRHAREAAAITQSKNNLKQLGLALYNYESTYSRFPIGVDITLDGTAKHGAFTRSLPFFESSPLYSWVSFNHAWDHPANWGLSSIQLPYLLVPDAEQTRQDGLALTHFATNGNLMYRNGSLGLSDLTDKTSNTWIAGEVQGDFVPWAYPFQWRELTWPLNAGPQSFGRPTKDRALFVLADGSVRFIDNDVDAQVLAELDGPEVEASRKAIPARPVNFSEFDVKKIEVIMYGAEPDDGPSIRKGGGDFGKAALDFLYANPDTEGLAVNGWTVQNTDLELLTSCKKLRFLRVGGVENDETLDRLKYLPTLKILVVGGELIFQRN